MSDSTNETSVTIKYGKGYEETWAVFKGGVDQVRRQIIHFFGIPEDRAAGMTPHELSVYGTSIAHGQTRIPSTVTVGATPEPTTEQAVQNVQAAFPGSEVVGDKAWDAVESQPETPAAPAGPDHSGLIAALTEAATTDELAKLWATNKAAFEDESVVAAYKARGKALSTAAA